MLAKNAYSFAALPTTLSMRMVTFSAIPTSCENQSNTKTGSRTDVVHEYTTRVSVDDT